MSNDTLFKKLVFVNLFAEPFGIDTADCNGPVNLSAPGAKKVQFAAARCGIGYWYRDAQYVATRDQAEKMGIPFLAYHVLIPGNDVKAQAKAFRSWAGEGCWGYSGDFEVANGCSPSIVSANTRDYLAETAGFGWRNVPYSSPGWINEYFRSQITYLLPDWINFYQWWLSQYLTSGAENPGPLSVPLGMKMENVLIFQTGSQEQNKYGSIYDSRFVDTDRWVGNGFPSVPVKPETTPVEVTPAPAETETGVMHVACNGLYVRSKPAKNSEAISLLLRGTPVNVVATKKIGDYIWVERAGGGWCAQKYLDFVYLI